VDDVEKIKFDIALYDTFIRIHDHATNHCRHSKTGYEYNNRLSVAIIQTSVANVGSGTGDISGGYSALCECSSEVLRPSVLVKYFVLVFW
jgi:hypothetical protein